MGPHSLSLLRRQYSHQESFTARPVTQLSIQEKNPTWVSMLSKSIYIDIYIYTYIYIERERERERMFAQRATALHWLLKRCCNPGHDHSLYITWHLQRLQSGNIKCRYFETFAVSHCLQRLQTSNVSSAETWLNLCKLLYRRKVL